MRTSLAFSKLKLLLSRELEFDRLGEHNVVLWREDAAFLAFIKIFVAVALLLVFFLSLVIYHESRRRIFFVFIRLLGAYGVG